MFKKITFSLVVITMTATLLAQEVKKEGTTDDNKMETFSSLKGTTYKIIDYDLPKLNVSKDEFGSVTTKVIKVIRGGEKTQYFYQVRKYIDRITYYSTIEYSDLLEMIRVLPSLKLEFDKDIIINPYFLQNYFVTNDGVKVGYKIDGSEQLSYNWIISAKRYASEEFVEIKDFETVLNALNGAKNKIEELMKL